MNSLYRTKLLNTKIKSDRFGDRLVFQLRWRNVPIGIIKPCQPESLRNIWGPISLERRSSNFCRCSLTRASEHPMGICISQNPKYVSVTWLQLFGWQFNKNHVIAWRYERYERYERSVYTFTRFQLLIWVKQPNTNREIKTTYTEKGIQWVVLGKLNWYLYLYLCRNLYLYTLPANSMESSYQCIRFASQLKSMLMSMEAPWRYIKEGHCLGLLLMWSSLIDAHLII